MLCECEALDPKTQAIFEQPKLTPEYNNKHTTNQYKKQECWTVCYKEMNENGYFFPLDRKGVRKFQILKCGEGRPNEVILNVLCEIRQLKECKTFEEWSHQNNVQNRHVLK